MLRIDVNQAQAGMRLAMPVRNPNRTSDVLLRVGYKLDPNTIARLQKMNIRELWVKYPGTEAIQRRIRPEVFEQRELLSQTVCELMTNFQGNTNAHLDYGVYFDTVTNMINELLNNQAAATFVDNLNHQHTTLMTHSTSVAFLSILMGVKLDAYLINQRRRIKPSRAKDVTNLGIGAMLHDIGMLSIDKEVLNRYEETRRFDDPEYQKHILIGYEQVRGKVDPSSSAIVLQHHQRYDGTGFPSGEPGSGLEARLEGDRIHVFARIVLVADIFETLHHPRPDVTIPMVRAMKMMIQKPLINWFDPEVLKAFFTVAAPYPPGTMVELSDGRYGVVIDHSPHEPCRPMVQLIASPDLASAVHEGTVEDQASLPMLDLVDHRHLHVVKAAGQSVEEHNFTLPEELKKYMKRRRMIKHAG